MNFYSNSKDLFYKLQRAAIKVTGNTIKVISYLFHFFFPKKRFLIPSFSSSSSRAEVDNPISRIVWQTNFTDKVTLPVYANYLFNRLFSRGFTYRFVSTDERLAFIEREFPEETVNAYRRLKIGASQADFWRIAVLIKHGGVYIDIDAHFVRSLEAIVRRKKEVFLLTRDGELTNYFIASCKNNDHLKKVLERMVSNIVSRSSNNIYHLTGPGLLNLVLRKEEVQTDSHWRTCNQGTFTNRHFQYIDRVGGKWVDQQRREGIFND